MSSDEDRSEMKIGTARDLAIAVRGRRTDLGLSQHQLASRADVSRSWLAKLELARPSAELSRLVALLDALGLDLDVSAGQVDDGPGRGTDRVELDLDRHLERYE
jgi:transcriptional regulator with XRE-family HTH domain